MSYQVFARKYRPRTFADVLGQDHVIQTLRNAIEQERLAHAYLFVGPRGTGKTTTARILAKALNCKDGPAIEFDPDESICVEIAEGRSLDVLEIDGASNNGVEQVRELRETVNYAPSSGRFKVYYIDEVHMLSNAAFNALLKTLEEPPEHVKFFFATTEPNKILPTIISRCQRFDLRPIPTDIIAGHLQYIATEENVTLDKAAAWAIAKGADGGMRDAQSMLDQLVSFCGNAITEANVQEVFGFTSSETVTSLAAAVLGKETAQSIALVQSEFERGKDLTQLLMELTGFLRSLLITRLDASSPSEGIPDELWEKVQTVAKNVSQDRLLAVLDNLADADAKMRRASNKQLHFEIALIRAIQSLDEVRISDVIRALEKAPENTAPAAPVQPAAPAPAAAAGTPNPPETPPPNPSRSPTRPKARRGTKQPEESKWEAMMGNAVESRPDDPPPEPEVPAPAKTPEPAPEPEATNDDFHDDPLIKDAMRMFEGKLKS
jgi:DNA polymerase-3 subunit gamma/tau